MAASANPSVSNQEGSSATAAQKVTSSSATAATNGAAVNSANTGENSGGGAAAADNNPKITALRHNPGISVDWSPEEQSLLEDLLAKYASESTIVRYATIAMQLTDKTVRDVAMRCRWMNKKENGKRRKEDHSSRKSKDRKERAADSSVKPSCHLNGPAMMPMDTDDGGISYRAIGGATGELLEQNAQMFDQISANFSASKTHENIYLFCKIRDNIHTILNDLNDRQGIMKLMPPLPVKMNKELANSFLPTPSHQTTP